MLKEIFLPDIGSYSGVDVIEVLVRIGDTIAKDVALITLETDKATMEIPSPFAGIVKSLNVKVGDKVSKGDLILTLEMSDSASAGLTGATEPDNATENKNTGQKTEAKSETKISSALETAKVETAKKDEARTFVARETIVDDNFSNEVPHAGPGVRRFARELGVDLRRVPGTGRKDRILLIDVKNYVKRELSKGPSSGGGAPSALSHIPAWPKIDHAQFGEISKEPLSRIKKLSGNFLHRNWVMVPHVTQFDEADITDLEHFRKDAQSLAEEGVKLTPLVFIMKAVTAALQSFPNFNASLDEKGSELILKKYFHIGVAVDTPNGLVVPVVRDVDQKGLFQLAKELGEISQKARKGALTALDMQGSSFSISSLGGVGGTAFTPIINVPDVAILGVSKSSIKAIYQNNEFKPRLMLPLSLSYDHRVIDGAEAARFTTFLVKQLSDIRRLLL